MEGSTTVLLHEMSTCDVYTLVPRCYQFACVPKFAFENHVLRECKHEEYHLKEKEVDC